MRVRKSHFHCFSSLQKRHIWCPKRKSETSSEIRSGGKQSAHFKPLESGFLAFSHFIYCFSSFYVPEKIQVSQKRKDFTTKCIKQNLFIAATLFQIVLWKLKFSIFVYLFVYLFVCTSHFANFAQGKWSIMIPKTLLKSEL